MVKGRFDLHQESVSQLMDHHFEAIEEETLEKFNGALTRDSLKVVLSISEDVVAQDYETPAQEAVSKVQHLKQALLQLKAASEKQEAHVNQLYVDQLSDAAKALSNHSLTQQQLLDARAREQSLLDDIYTERTVLKRENSRILELSEDLDSFLKERRKLLQWKADNSLSFIELQAQARDLEHLQVYSTHDILSDLLDLPPSPFPSLHVSFNV